PPSSTLFPYTTLFRSVFGSACPMIVIDGVVVHEPSGRRALGIQVYGVDDRFWKFQAEPGEPPRNQQTLLSAALERELGVKAGDTDRKSTRLNSSHGSI